MSQLSQNILKASSTSVNLQCKCVNTQTQYNGSGLWIGRGTGEGDPFPPWGQEKLHLLRWVSVTRHGLLHSPRLAADHVFALPPSLGCGS